MKAVKSKKSKGAKRVATPDQREIKGAVVEKSRKGNNSEIINKDKLKEKDDKMDS